VNDQNGLCRALLAAKEASRKVATYERGWDGNRGKTWDTAERTCFLYWFDDGSIKIVPQVRIPEEIDEATGDVLSGGLVDQSDRAQTLGPDTPVEVVCDRMISMLTSP